MRNRIGSNIDPHGTLLSPLHFHSVSHRFSNFYDHRVLTWIISNYFKYLSYTLTYCNAFSRISNANALRALGHIDEHCVCVIINTVIRFWLIISVSYIKSSHEGGENTTLFFWSRAVFSPPSLCSARMKNMLTLHHQSVIHMLLLF